MYQSPVRRQPGDERLSIFFFTDAIEDVERTEQEGRPVFKDVDFIRIVIPPAEWAPNGEERTAKVTKQHQDRFPLEYREFKASQREAPDGSPLKMWPALTPASLKELTAHGLYTIEQVADISDRELRTYEWLKPWQEKAKNWLDSLDGNKALLRLEGEVARLKAEIEVLKSENEMLRTTPVATEQKHTRRVNSR